MRFHFSLKFCNKQIYKTECGPLIVFLLSAQLGSCYHIARVNVKKTIMQY